VIEISEREGSFVFAVRVIPQASRDAIEGEYQGALKVASRRRPLKTARMMRFGVCWPRV
jgi:uncharacterized protein YggU (UPF0235/DUF167 family)